MLLGWFCGCLVVWFDLVGLGWVLVCIVVVVGGGLCGGGLRLRLFWFAW